MTDSRKESKKRLSIRDVFRRPRSRSRNPFNRTQQAETYNEPVSPALISPELCSYNLRPDLQIEPSLTPFETSSLPCSDAQDALFSQATPICYAAIDIDSGYKISVSQLTKCQSDHDCNFCSVLIQGLLAIGKLHEQTVIILRWDEMEFIGGKQDILSLWLDYQRYELYRSLSAGFDEAAFAQPLVRTTPPSKLSMKEIRPIAKPLDRIGTRSDISSHNFDQACISRLKAWLQNCRTEHDICGIIPAANNGPNAFPRRMIDVGEQHGTPHLCEFASVFSTDVPYVALSHCWGSLQTYKTEKHTLRSRMDGMPWEELPATFKDAIEVTRCLGIRYIWIDSLCIVQDDMDDWAAESSKMCHVYSNATMTIAAAAACNDTVGFLGPREWLSKPILIKGQDTGFAIRRNVHLNLAQRGPLIHRGWVFQERMLSRRILYFEEHEMRWECRKVRYCECSSDLSSAPYRMLETAWSSFLHPEFERDTSPLGTYIFTQGCSDEETYRWWRRAVVYTYASLALAKPSDRLPALSGIAAAVQNKTKDVYLAGLWVSDLPQGLLWRPGGSGTVTGEGSTISNSYVAPSWSWASVIAIRGHLNDFQFTATLMQLVGHDMKLSTIDPTGAVSDGEVRLRCPFFHNVAWGQFDTNPGTGTFILVSGIRFEVQTMEYDTPVENTRIKTPEGWVKCVQRTSSTPYRRRWEFGGAIHPMIALAARNEPRNKTLTLMGLVLGLSASRPGAYTRVGTFEAVGYGHWACSDPSRPLFDRSYNPEVERIFSSHWREITLV